MTLLLALILAQSVAEPPIAADTAEIVVTARRLSKRWGGRAETVNGQTICTTTKSTGVDEFDAIGCKAMLVCWPEFLPQIEAAIKAETAAGRIKTREDLDRAHLKKPLRNIWRKTGKCIQGRMFPDIKAAIKRRKTEEGG